MDSYLWNNEATTSSITVSPTITTTYTVSGSYNGVSQVAQSVIDATWTPANLSDVLAWFLPDSLFQNIEGYNNWWSLVNDVKMAGTGTDDPVKVTNQISGKSVIRFSGVVLVIYRKIPVLQIWI